jgi:hypothetical protein
MTNSKNFGATVTNIIRVIKLKGMVLAVYEGHLGELQKVYKIFVGKPGWKRPLGRPRSGWEDDSEWIFEK